MRVGIRGSSGLDGVGDPLEVVEHVLQRIHLAWLEGLDEILRLLERFGTDEPCLVARRTGSIKPEPFD